jgi:ribose-phosphate pyrophosphokinase
MHPFKPIVLHVDFQRVDATTRITKKVPLHFVNEENSPAVKTDACVIMDDMIDTAGTLVKAAEVLKARGARSVFAYCTHAVFSGPAIERIRGSQIDEVVITDTIPLNPDGMTCTKVRQLSVAFLFAETIRRISDGESVTSLFAEQNSNF